MGLFDGAFGRGLGAAALGYNAGENSGEAEAYRRLQQQQANELRKLMAQARYRPQKEDEPLPLKALFEARERVISSNDPTAWRNWQATGQEALFQQVSRGYTEGYTRGGATEGRRLGMGVLSVAGRPEGEDVTEPLAALAQRGATANTPRVPNAYVSPAARAQAQQQTAGDYSWVKPALKVGAAPTYSPLDDARTREIDSNIRMREELHPWNIEKAKDELLGNAFDRDVKMREFNLNAAFKLYGSWLDQFKALTNYGQDSFEAVADLWGKLLNFEGQLITRGQQAGRDLVPLLKSRGLNGELLNGPAARMYLQQKGYTPEQIETILSGYPRKVDNQGQMVSGVSGGAAPVQAPPGGWPTQGSAPHLAGAQDWVKSQGWVVTSEIGKAKPGVHNDGSQHYRNNAFDISVKGKTPEQVDQLIATLQRQGLTVIDERNHPPGQKKWSGPHLHVEGPRAQVAGVQQTAGGNQPPVLARVPGSPPAPGEGVTVGPPTAGAMPPGAPAGGPPATGVNTPATAPQVQNPYDQASQPFEWNVIQALVGGKPGQQLLNELHNQFGPDLAARAQGLIEWFEQRRGANFFQGIPGPVTHGARIPTPPSVGGLMFGAESWQHYAPGAPAPANPTPGVPTRAVTPVAIGQQPEVIVEAAPAAPVAPPEPPPAPPAGDPTFATSPYSPPAQPATGGPSVVGRAPDAPSTASVVGRAPDAPGPSVVGAPQAPPPGPSVVSTPPKGKLPRVKISERDQEASHKRQMEMIATAAPLSAAEKKEASKSVQVELSRYEKHELAAGVKKWLGKHKITSPEQKRQVYKYALSELAKEVVGLPPAERNGKIFRLLEQRLKPRS